MSPVRDERIGGIKWLRCTRRIRSVALWVLITLCIAAMAIAGCDRTPTARFIVPSGFRGPFKVVPVDDPAAVDGPQRTGDVLTFTIPSSGVFHARAADLPRLFSAQAVFTDDTALPIGDAAADSMIALRPLFTTIDETVWFLVGTRQDEIAAWERGRVGPLEPGSVEE